MIRNPKTDNPPMLLADRPFELGSPGWVYEIKWDGYRMLADLGANGVHLRSKAGTDITKWFPEIANSLQQLGAGYVLDGEICAFDDAGRSDFDRLRERAKHRRFYKGAPPVAYCVFDLLVDREVNVTQMPLHERKRRLAKLLENPPPGIIYAGYFEYGDSRLKGMKPESLVAKKADSAYQPGVRSKDWVKIKREGSVPLDRRPSMPMG